MKGTIIRRGGRYSVVLERPRDPATGKRRREWHSGFATKREAEAARIDLLARAQRGEHVPPSKLTLAAFLEDRWLPARAGDLRASTLRSYAGNIRVHVVPHLGSIQLQALAPDALTRFYADRLQAAALSPTTVRYLHTILRMALADAAKWGLITRNVADAVSPPSLKTPETMRTWDAAQLKSFLDHASSDRLSAAWRLAAMTGMRRGEILGLRWRDLDLDGGRLAVQQTLIGDREISKPKTNRSRRNVALDAETVRALRTHRKRQLEERLAWGSAYEEEHDLVFTREDGSPIWPRTFSRTFTALARETGLPTLRFHDLRHTHASLALAAGIHPKVVSERLGHSSVSITLDTYSHAIPALQEDAAARVAALLPV